jgi:MOSC domain-containing protein YiiM
MNRGRLLAIQIAPSPGAPVRVVAEASAVAGRGLEGDRNFVAVTRAAGSDPSHEITLIESESIEALEREYDVAITPADSRRNLVTQHVPLNHLVGRTFRVGEVELRGIRLCEPCGHLESLTKSGVRKGLIHRGGLRAQIVRGGTVRAGDPIVQTAP